MSGSDRPIESLNVGELIRSIGEKTPTPGGGAVAAVTAALAAAIGRMVVNFSAGKKSLAQHATLHETALRELEHHAAAALALADADARAYSNLNALWKLDKNDPKRAANWTNAVQQAIAAPRAVLQQAVDTLRLLERLVGATAPMLSSDLAIAAVLGEAAARAAAWNVRINLPLLDDKAEMHSLQDQMTASLDDAKRICGAVEAACTSAA